MTKALTADSQALQLYLQGRFHYEKLTEASLKKAVDSFESALSQVKKALELDPAYAFAHHWAGFIYMLKEQYPQAIHEFELVGTTGGETPLQIASLGAAHARAGSKTEANRRLADLTRLSKQRYVGGAMFALIYCGLGEKDKALESLEKAVNPRDPINWLKDPDWDPIRSGPRFDALLRRVGLPR